MQNIVRFGSQNISIALSIGTSPWQAIRLLIIYDLSVQICTSYFWNKLIQKQLRQYQLNLNLLTLCLTYELVWKLIGNVRNQ